MIAVQEPCSCIHSSLVTLLLPLTCVRMQNSDRLDNEIRYDRDFDYDYFGFKVHPTSLNQHCSMPACVPLHSS